MSYRVMVNTYGDPPNSWAGNAMKYETVTEAAEAARDLFYRWTAVEKWRVVEVDNESNVLAEGP